MVPDLMSWWGRRGRIQGYRDMEQKLLTVQWTRNSRGAGAGIQRPTVCDLLPPARAEAKGSTPREVSLPGGGREFKRGCVEAVHIQTITLPEPTREGSCEFCDSVSRKHVSLGKVYSPAPLTNTSGQFPKRSLNKYPREHPHSPSPH